MNKGLYNKVFKFNTLGNNLDVVTKESLALQLDLIQEEYVETVDAFDNEDSVEFADGVADMYVVLMGLIQKLEKLGVPMEKIINDVCGNNLSKFPIVTENMSSIIPANTKYTVVDGRLVIKNIQTGKIMKPLNFKPVDLSYTPNFFATLEVV